MYYFFWQNDLCLKGVWYFWKVNLLLVKMLVTRFRVFTDFYFIIFRMVWRNKEVWSGTSPTKNNSLFFCTQLFNDFCRITYTGVQKVPDQLNSLKRRRRSKKWLRQKLQEIFLLVKVIPGRKIFRPFHFRCQN